MKKSIPSRYTRFRLKYTRKTIIQIIFLGPKAELDSDSGNGHATDGSDPYAELYGPKPGSKPASGREDGKWPHEGSSWHEENSKEVNSNAPWYRKRVYQASRHFYQGDTHIVESWTLIQYFVRDAAGLAAVQALAQADMKAASAEGSTVTVQLFYFGDEDTGGSVTWQQLGAARDALGGKLVVVCCNGCPVPGVADHTTYLDPPAQRKWFMRLDVARQGRLVFKAAEEGLDKAIEDWNANAPREVDPTLGWSIPGGGEVKIR